MNYHHFFSPIQLAAETLPPSNGTSSSKTQQNHGRKLKKATHLRFQENIGSVYHMQLLYIVIWTLMEACLYYFKGRNFAVRNFHEFREFEYNSRKFIPVFQLLI